MPLIFVRDDLTRMAVDAIVCPTDPRLSGGGGLDRMIREAGGPALVKECTALGDCPVGQVRLTGGGELPCKYVIHTAGPVWKGGGHREVELLASCYEQALALARSLDCSTLALPLISAGTFRFPRELVLGIARRAIEDFLNTHDMTVYLVVYDRVSFAISQALFDHVSSFIDDHYIHRRREKGPFASLDSTGAGDGEMSCTLPLSADEGRSESHILTAPRPCSALVHQKKPSGKKEPSLAEQLQALDAGFSETLLHLIDERGMTDVACYKKANIDRKLFSKIRSDKHYRPSKATVLAFAIALELDLPQTRALLEKAGFALSRASKFDVIIEYFIKTGNYDMFEINQTLFAFDQNLLGA